MRLSLILRSVTATWAAVFVSAVTSFFLTPYILHRLGDEAYGLWVLIVALSDYYMFLQVGVRSAIVRYVSRNLALHDTVAVNRIAATGFYFFMCLFVLVNCIAVALAHRASIFFAIKPANVAAFTGLFMLLGFAQACDFPLSLFEGCLEAVGRFDQLYSFRIIGMLVRVAAIVIVLHRGGGLLGVGAATVLSTLSLRFLAVPLAFREVAGFSLSPKGIDFQEFKEMLGYGATTLGVGIGVRLRDSLYPVVIAKFLSASAVTLFAIPAKLLAVPLSGIGTMTEFVNPLSSQLDARKDTEGLRRILIGSTEAAYLLFAPLTVLMIVLGKPMLSLWVGNRYSSAYPLLVLLAFGLGISATQASTQSMLFGIGKHRPLVWLRLAEGLGMAGLGIILMRVWGLWGYAFASMIVPVVVNLILVPRYACGLVDLPLLTYLSRGCLKACVFSVPLTVALVGFAHIFPVSSWAGVIAAGIGGGGVYLLTLLAAARMSKNPGYGWLSLDTLVMVEKGWFNRDKNAELSGPETTAVLEELDRAEEANSLN